MEHEIDRIECAIRHIESALDVDPWACEIAVRAMRELIKHTEPHRWIPVTERLPNHELAIVQYSDGDFDLLQFPTAYRRKDIVAWMPLPEPYAERGQDETD